MWHDWRRRTLLRGSFALAIASVLPKGAHADWRLAPALTEGPFYPEAFPADSDPDRLQVARRTSTSSSRPSTAASSPRRCSWPTSR